MKMVSLCQEIHALWTSQNSLNPYIQNILFNLIVRNYNSQKEAVAYPSTKHQFRDLQYRGYTAATIALDFNLDCSGNGERLFCCLGCILSTRKRDTHATLAFHFGLAEQTDRRVFDRSCRP